MSPSDANPRSSGLKGPPAVISRFATLNAALERAGATAEHLLFTDPHDVDTPYPYKTLLAEARQFAGALAALGVVPGDRVAMVLPTCPGFVRAYFGSLLAGATPVPLYPPVRLARLEEYHHRTARMLEAVGARVLITDGRVRRLLGQAVEKARPALGCHTLEELAGQAVAPLQREVAPTDLALIQFSSGSTADPKPVALNHSNILANVAAIDSFLPQGDTHPSGASWLPLYHDMGLIGCLLVAVYHAAPLTLIPPELFVSRPAIWLKALSRSRATVSPAPNFAYGLCLKRIRDEELAGVDLSHWKLALNGAEPISPAVLSRFIERFSAWGFDPGSLTPVYGLSEASLAVTFSKPGARFTSVDADPELLAREGKVVVASGAPGAEPGKSRSIVSVGTPLPGVEVRVCSEEGVDATEGQVGRVRVRAPSVMTGYFGNPEATARALSDGWLDTGDLGFIHQGQLYICGRAKEVVILRGANHAPQEFEDCLDGIEGVRAGCSVAFGYIPEGADGEELGLLVEWQGEVEADTAERIRGRVTERTGIRPHVVELLKPGTIPRTSSGKLRRLDAAMLYQEGQLHTPGKVNAFKIAVEVVKSEIGHLRSRFPKGDA